MYSDRAIKLTKEEYNYLLPTIYRKNLLCRGEVNEYSIIVNTDTIDDVLNRLKGLYDYFDMLPSKVVNKCFVLRSFIPFRELFKK